MFNNCCMFASVCIHLLFLPHRSACAGAVIRYRTGVHRSKPQNWDVDFVLFMDCHSNSPNPRTKCQSITFGARDCLPDTIYLPVLLLSELYRDPTTTELHHG